MSVMWQELSAIVDVDPVSENCLLSYGSRKLMSNLIHLIKEMP